jgi:hypothetical protein
MPKYLLLALNGPVPGTDNEEAYHRWYDEVHLPAFRAIEGVRSARRFKVLRGKLPGMEAWPYVAAYEIETDDLTKVSARLAEQLQSFPPSLDRSRSAHLMAVEITGDLS